MMVQWKNNSNTFIEVEWQGAQDEPRIELPEGPFYMAAWLPKISKGVCITRVFLPGEF